MAGRSEGALIELERELSRGGDRAVTVTADVGKPADVQRISRVARQMFGGFDTWINNAGVSMYGRLLDEPIEDMRRLFETNFWGLVYGSLEAARYFKERDQAGAIINVGSTLSDRALVLRGMALRMEVEMDHIPISTGRHRDALFSTCQKFYENGTHEPAARLLTRNGSEDDSVLRREQRVPCLRRGRRERYWHDGVLRTQVGRFADGNVVCSATTV
ncbi:MAG: SDR family NAD(P)-dependent oxidoreductase [Nitrospira sp.]|nr:SDR family NAD(P)-dependent oxidoreductase [Nitrospira sp.]